MRSMHTELLQMWHFINEVHSIIDGTCKIKYYYPHRYNVTSFEAAIEYVCTEASQVLEVFFIYMYLHVDFGMFDDG